MKNTLWFTRLFKKLFSTHRHFIFGFFLILCGLTYIYRGALLEGKILFPSNLLVSFFSPWSTTTFPGWGHAIPNKPIGGNDQLRLFYPGRTLTNEAIREGRFPLWNPYTFSGSPLLANFQSAVFYPLHLLYLLLPQITAWSVLVITPFVLGFIFMYIFLSSLGCHPKASLIGSIAFSFSGFIAAWTQENAAVGQTALWLPIMLFSGKKMIETGKLKYLILSSIVLSCSFLSGFYQLTFYQVVIYWTYCLFLVFYRIERDKGKKILLLFGSFCFFICICSVQLLPSIEAFYLSPRGSTSVWYLFEQYLLPVSHLLHVFFPDLNGNPGYYNYFGSGFYHETLLYIGIIPLVFALYSIKIMRKNSTAVFFLLVTVISIFLTIKSPFTTWFYHLNLPLLSTFLPSRILYVATFSLAVLSGLGSNYYLTLEKQKAQRFLRRICVLMSLCMALPAFYVGIAVLVTMKISPSIATVLHMLYITPLSHSQLMIMLKNMALSWVMIVSIYLLSLTRIKQSLKLIILILLTALGQFYFLQKYSVVGYRQFLYPDHFIFSYLKEKNDLYRFIAFGRSILGNVASDKHIYAPFGLDAVFPNRYGQLVQAAKNGGIVKKDVPRIEVGLSELGETESLVDNDRRLRLLSLLGIKYIFFYLEEPIKTSDLPHKIPAEQFQFLWEKEHWYAYENKQVLPRVFLTTDYTVQTTDQGIVDALFAKDFDPRKKVVMEEPITVFSPIPTNHQPGTATILLYEPEQIRIQSTSNSNSILFLSDNYYPGWQAYIDGRETKIYRADYTFRAVILPPGTHLVIFRFKPVTFYLGLKISIFSVSLFFLIVPLKIFLSKK